MTRCNKGNITNEQAVIMQLQLCSLQSTPSSRPDHSGADEVTTMIASANGC